MDWRKGLLTALLLLALVLVLGGVVRSGGEAVACPDWPTCFGRWLPPSGPARWAYAHRALTALAGLALTAAWVWARRQGARGAVLGLLGAALVGLALQSLGGLGLVYRPSTWATAWHLALALVTLGLATAATALAWLPEPAQRWRREDGLAWGGLALVAGLGALWASGGLVSALAAGHACAAWPLCPGLSPRDGGAFWAVWSHRGLTLLVGLGLWAWSRRVWAAYRTEGWVLVPVGAAGALFLGQVLVGAFRVWRGFPPVLLGLHVASTVALWMAVVAAVVVVGWLPRPAPRPQPHPDAPPRWRDFLALTKPVVVALLLVTTYAGMVVGARAWPALGVTFWTLLGGALAAGGSSAINQYIDRERDARMQRTWKRPIPAGRLTPAEGLAFGVVLCVLAFYEMAFMVNLLSALLSLAGMVYYVVLYSLWLKPRTPQNIVIGGGAGAIPPLVGWAAVTGRLDVPALFLFALVFFWTPPHFWALALVRRKDYARAQVPMLPVVRGEAETRRQIFFYTVELVLLSLVTPFFGLGGAVYFVAALVLGLWLLGVAYRVWKQGGNRLAWKMYRYSSMYLAFLMLALMVDAVLR